MINHKVRKYLIDAARDKTRFVYYSEIVSDCGLRLNLRSTTGQKKLNSVLDEVSEFENSAGRPLLSALAIYKDIRRNDHGDGFYYNAEKLGKGNARKLKRELFGFTEAESCRRFWQNDENYTQFG
ncbi:MAG: hypothetical protein MUE56_10180 [Ignavibacteria bacterium]|jgi:hypothetical protein|nr:hypothetical protein [Ignavibacteria bacterium]